MLSSVQVCACFFFRSRLFLNAMLTGGSTSDACLNCPYQLSTGQAWVSGCQWQCVAGYSLSTQPTCAPCASGQYKPSLGNQSCLNCGSGSYALSTISCVSCAAGTFSSSATATACIACVPGSFSAQSQATACINCTSLSTWPNSFSASASSIACSLCPWSTPSSPNGAACLSAAPPCPAGYYLPYLGTACVLCPVGTFCVAGNQPSFCPPSLPLSVQPSISIANCTATGATLNTAGCPPNTTTNPYQCLPNAGYYGFGATVQICPYDTFCPPGSIVPIACPSGTTAPMGSFNGTTNCTTYMVLPCRPGYFAPNGSSSLYCLGCIAGCYCPGQSAILACNASSSNYSSPLLAVSATQCSSGTSSVVSSCPLYTQAGQQPLSSLLQCRANAGYYYLPGSSASAIPCPVNNFCPLGSLVPQACASPISTCAQAGQFPTPSLCPLSNMPGPLPLCQNCSGLPSYAFWTSSSDPSCPFCCQSSYYRSVSLIQLDELRVTLPLAYAGMPPPVPCTRTPPPAPSPSTCPRLPPAPSVFRAVPRALLLPPQPWIS